MLEVDREEAVVPGGPAHRLDVAGEPRDPYRDAGSLHGPGEKLDVVDRVVVAVVVVHRLTAPGGGDDLQCLVEPLAPNPVVDLLAGLRELAREPVLPIPTPRERQPPLSTSNVAVSRATLTGRRRGSGVTMGPSRSRSGAAAIAASLTHESATGAWRLPTQVVPHEDIVPAGRLRVGARPTTANGSASSSNSGSDTPDLKAGPRCLVPASTINAPGLPVASMLAHALESDDPGWRHTNQHPELLTGEPHEVLSPLAGVVALVDPPSDLLDVPDVP